MKLLILLLFFVKIINSQIFDEIQVDYYKKIIENGINESFKFVLPNDASMHRSLGDDIKVEGDFDYIIIGSGSAGSVLANRLSQNEINSVLLLEAGGYENDFSVIPAMADYLMTSRYNWNFKSTPQKYSCLGYIDERCPIPRGKGIGGSTLINFLLYSRGTHQSYDEWAALGFPSFSYKNVLGSLKKLENANFPFEAPYHSRGGDQNVEQNDYETPHLRAFLEGNRELGQSLIDYNGASIVGASKTQLNLENGKRMSAGKAFVLKAKSRPNLRVSINSFVTKIIFQNKTAVGVEFTRNKRKFIAYANKEIILSAGALSSPKILMLSGLGHPKHLLRNGIKPLANLPVGDNLQDHPSYNALTFTTDVSIEAFSLEENVRRVLKNRGAFTLPARNAGISFFSRNGREGELELTLFSPDVNSNYPVSSMNLKPSNLNAFRKTDNLRTFNLIVYFHMAKSIGNVRLSSGDPFDYPKIFSNQLKEQYDVDALRDGIRLAMKLVRTEAFQRMNASLVEFILPDCKNLTYLSDDFFDCQIRQLSGGTGHPMGTCRMGSVVDEFFRVKGVENLRVADGSVIPFALVGHSSTSCSLVGEKLAEILNRNDTT